MYSFYKLRTFVLILNFWLNFPIFSGWSFNMKSNPIQNLTLSETNAMRSSLFFSLFLISTFYPVIIQPLVHNGTFTLS